MASRFLAAVILVGMAASPASAQTGAYTKLPPQGLVHTGQRGPAVANIQRVLAACGAQLQVDGRFGAETLIELVAFQRANGLAVDGIVGPETRGALARALTALQAPKVARVVAPPPAKPAVARPAPVAATQVEPQAFSVPGPAGGEREFQYLADDGRYLRQAQRFDGRTWENVGEPSVIQPASR